MNGLISIYGNLNNAEWRLPYGSQFRTLLRNRLFVVSIQTFRMVFCVFSELIADEVMGISTEGNNDRYKAADIGVRSNCIKNTTNMC